MLKDKRVHLSFRQREILAMLLSREEPMDFTKLVNQYKLSAKSIRNDLKLIELWVQENGAALHWDDNRVFLAIPEDRRQSLSASFEKIDHTDYLCKNERVAFLLSRLLLGSGPLTSIQLCEDMKVSKPTILSDLTVVEEHLNRHNLILNRKRGVGYWVSGEEYQIRQAMERRVLAMLKEYQITGTGRLFSLCGSVPKDSDPLYQFLAESDASAVRGILLTLSERADTDIPEEDLLALAVMFLVMLRRLCQGKRIQVDWPVCRQNIHDWPMAGLADACLHVLRGVCPQDISPWERHFLVYKLYQYGVRVHFPEEKREPELDHTVRNMLQVLLGQILLQEDAQEQLQSDLYDYLDFVLHRKKLNITTHNSFYVSTKAAYPQLFLMAQKLASSFQQEQGVALSQDEIGFLSLLIATYRTGDDGKRRAIVVCDKDDMLAKVLTRRLRNNIPELTIAQTMSLGEYQSTDIQWMVADVVISTTALPDCPLPVFRVDPIADYGELQRIRDYAVGRRAPGVSPLRGRDVIAECLRRNTGRTISEKTVPLLTEALVQELDGVSDSTAQRLLRCREEYSRDLANILARLNVLAAASARITGRPVSIDALLGLAIHLTLSMVLWENGGIYPSEDATGLESEDPKLLEAVEDFLEDVGRQIGNKLPRSEAIPILQYLKQSLI